MKLIRKRFAIRMNKATAIVTFLLGAAAILWIGAGFWGAHWLAFAVTTVIAIAYLVGSLELLKFSSETTALQRALGTLKTPPATLTLWLDRIPEAFQTGVRRSIEGGPLALPGPVLTPYLVGLLVMLGMLGTFLGMVVTLNGAALALDGTTDLETIRTALSAPIKGLGQAFGTSVAGVAASAMLGLLSALCRRERILVARRLEVATTTDLAALTPRQQQRDTLTLLQEQASALPEAAQTLHAMAATLEQIASKTQGVLEENQRQFQHQAAQTLGELGIRIEQTLKDRLLQIAAQTEQAMAPLLQHTLSQLLQASADQQALLAERQTQLLESTHEHQLRLLDASSKQQTHLIQANLEQHRQLIGTSLEQLTQILHTGQNQFAQLASASQEQLAQIVNTNQSHQKHLLESTHAQQLELIASTHQRLDAMLENFSGSTLAVAQHWQQGAGEMQQQLSEQAHQWQGRWHEQLTHFQQSHEQQAQIVQMLQGASEREHRQWQAHQSTLAKVDTVLAELHERQVSAQNLAETSANTLKGIASQFTQHIDEKLAPLHEAANQINTSGTSVAQLSETLESSVQRFGEFSEKLYAQLQHAEQSLQQADQRHNEQLAYYVAQAREIIDLSVMAQKDVFEELQRIRKPAARAAEAL
ncbi:Hypothetical protein HDN1F_27870 [gamma proteobacterium HdN1]|nr:Hypothetical protein HDN1F_27870 [gamma proteobacterium HdN1]